MVTMIVIDLQDGLKAGSLEACEFFAKEFVQLKKKNPGISFQLVPFSYSQMPGENNAHVTSIMAVAF